MRTRIDTERFRVRQRARVDLARYDPSDTAPFESSKGTRRILEKTTRRLLELTELLYAQNRYSVLFILQAMDGAGKDSAIKHVLRGLDPKATDVHSFGPPSAREMGHDFMWRCLTALPERGRIGIFNRSYYEEVLVARVRPHVLASQHLPPSAVSKRIWKERFEDIRDIERYLGRNGVVIRKIFLNVSKKEQRNRFLERLSNPAKKWKFSINDVNERLRWKEYMSAYEEAMSATSTLEAPWYVLPADNKWFTRLALAQVVIETLQSIDLRVPDLSHRRRRELHDAKRRLRAK
ncbi:MAG TPA: PPK2 family polyphosphate kinase [Vicinamibacterales bacterium]|nr:PPK2 family polyphosphate kinase [Vicinamibacterales bacterium]